MLTGVLILFPLLASLLLFFIKGDGAKRIAFVFSLVEFGISLLAYVWFRGNANMDMLSLNCTWVESLGIKFAVGLDGIGLLFFAANYFPCPA